MSWCIGGDFSVVRYPCERSGDSRQSQTMLEFSEFIFVQGFIDIPLVGGLGLIIEILRHGLELIGSSYIRSGKNVFWMYLRDPFLESC
jgi:hypothetical protein